MATTYGIEHDGVDVEVAPMDGWTDGVTLHVDGTQVAKAKKSTARFNVDVDGIVVAVWMSGWGRIRSADLVLADGTRLPMAARPQAGTWSARLHAWGERHPRTWASRHGVAGVFNAALLFVGFGFLLRLLPDIDAPNLPLPNVPWPSIDLPRIPWPSIPWPDVTIPGWVSDAKRIIQAVVLVAFGAYLARREHGRQRAIREREGRADDAHPRDEDQA